MLVLFIVGLFFVLAALGLAVGAVPEQEDHQAHDEDDVGDDDGGDDGGQVLGVVVRLDHDPRVDRAGVDVVEILLEHLFNHTSRLRCFHRWHCQC